MTPPLPAEPSTATTPPPTFLPLQELVESPVDEHADSGELRVREAYFDHRTASPHAAHAATWPTYRGHAGSTSDTEEREHVSENPAFSIAHSLRTGTSSDFSQVPYGASGSDALPRSRRSPSEYRLLSVTVADRSTIERRMATESIMDPALPENDGMQSLRHQLLQIRELALSTEEKAKRMHELMTRDYLKLKHVATQAATTPDAINQDHLQPLRAQPIDPANPYNIQPGDLEQTFSPFPHLSDQAEHDTDDSVEEENVPALGCPHYKRNVKVQCFDCHRWSPCRHCHDSAPDLSFPHVLNRKKTQNMLCMLCKTPQPAAETCMNCGEYAAWYYCPKCKLWDNDSNKRIYHCDDCGLCRLGEGLGKDFVHCRRCNVCISIATSSSHPCIERATDSDCPLCLSYLFESPTPVVSLPCGHYMHGACYKDLMAVTYKCPVCSKSAVNMELQWAKLDDEIAMQPMPEDDEDLGNLLPHLEGVVPTTDGTDAEVAARRPRKAWIGCNDCGGRCWTPFHWLGLKCQYCGCYNTNQMPPTTGHETEAERIIRQQQLQPRQHDFTGNAVLLDAGIGLDPDSDDGNRVDSAYAMPSSPTSLSPATAAMAGSPSYVNSGRRSSAAQSPRRYFVQEDEPRRASFTAPRFPTPSMPNLPRIPDLPTLPNMPTLPNLPNLPNMPNLPNLPNLPNMPNMPNLELPRFSPYEFVQSLSRSLSPMRYYMEGLDMSDIEHMAQNMTGQRSRSARPSVRRSHDEVPASSPPVTGPEEKRPRTSSDVPSSSNLGFFWGSAVMSDDEEDVEDDEEDESEEDDEDEEDEEDNDEHRIHGDSSDVEDTEPDDEFEIFGHR